MADLISILLPVYNAQQFLADCLRSIQAQTHTDFEAVIVDDGSTDDTPRILSDYSSRDHRIRVLTLPENSGIVDAMNHGLKACRGSWIARMDADDIMHPHRLERQIQYFENHPETDILGTKVRVFRDDGELTVGQQRYQDWSNSLLTNEDIRREIFAESPIMHPTFFLRREYYNKLGGYCDFPWAEDYDFLLRACRDGARFAKLTDVLVEKRDSPTRLARLDDRCKRRAMFAAKAHYFSKENWHHSDQKLLIAGSGSSGRIACTALRKEGVTVHGFVDNIDGGPGRTVAGLPAYTLDYQNPDRFFERLDKPGFLLCIGMPAGRQLMEQLLTDRGYQPGIDYLRFI